MDIKKRNRFLNLGNYSRSVVTNLDVLAKKKAKTTSLSNDLEYKNVETTARDYFDIGLRHLLSYHHEIALIYFHRCLDQSPDCALVYGLIALCHCPNYNFKGDAYYDYPDSYNFPSQKLGEQYSRLAMEKIEELKTLHSPNICFNGHGTRKREEHKTKPINNVEVGIITAIRKLTCKPGILSIEAERHVGRPYACAFQLVYQQYPNDLDVAYWYAESLMVLNAWKLYNYPHGNIISTDVTEIEKTLDASLIISSNHAENSSFHMGLCHLYVHLCEMSSKPQRALKVCSILRNDFPDSGHLIHMPSHIDVLMGDYEACVISNETAITADSKLMNISPETAGPTSFYFGYIVHNYHMLVYGCILGGFEKKAREVAQFLNEQYLSEDWLSEHPNVVPYLESYSSMDIHILVRFGRWNEILGLKLPVDEKLMLYRTATIRYARALAYSNLSRLKRHQSSRHDLNNKQCNNYIKASKVEADKYDILQANPIAKDRILHNNTVAQLLAVDVPMIRGEIAYAEKNYQLAFELLRKAIKLDDTLKYDEPWGKMQPIRHALGGLLLKRGLVDEAEKVFQSDLLLHPKNPWSMKGLIQCLDLKLSHDDNCNITKKKKKSLKQCCDKNITKNAGVCVRKKDHKQLCLAMVDQRNSKWADFKITHSCACCCD